MVHCVAVSHVVLIHSLTHRHTQFKADWSQPWFKAFSPIFLRALSCSSSRLHKRPHAALRALQLTHCPLDKPQTETFSTAHHTPCLLPFGLFPWWSVWQHGHFTLCRNKYVCVHVVSEKNTFVLLSFINNSNTLFSSIIITINMALCCEGKTDVFRNRILNKPFYRLIVYICLWSCFYLFFLCHICFLFISVLLALRSSGAWTKPSIHPSIVILFMQA